MREFTVAMAKIVICGVAIVTLFASCTIHNAVPADLGRVAERRTTIAVLGVGVVAGFRKCEAAIATPHRQANAAEALAGALTGLAARSIGIGGACRDLNGGGTCILVAAATRRANAVATRSPGRLHTRRSSNSRDRKCDRRRKPSSPPPGYGISAHSPNVARFAFQFPCVASVFRTPRG